MISLNLLPPEEKKEAALKRSHLLIRDALVALSIVMIFISGILLVSKIVLVNELTKAREQLALVNPTKSATRQQIVSYNKKLAELKDINKEFIPCSTIVLEIIEVVPSGITIDTLELDNTSQNVIIDGNATSRNDLLNLEENLKSVDFLESIHLPLNNKLMKNNIDFAITAKMNVADINFYENKDED